MHCNRRYGFTVRNSTLPTHGLHRPAGAAAASMRAPLLAIALSGTWITGWARAEVIRVEADGSGDVPTIQSALVIASDGDVIELGDGTYRGLGNREVTFLGKAVSVVSASDNPENCVIDCQGTVANPRRGFLFNEGETNATVLQGVKVINGWRGAIQYPAGDGAGILIDGAGPIIRNCIFERNYAGKGGGVGSHFTEGAILERCIFRENRAILTGGGVFVHGSGITIRECVFSGNVSEGAGGGLALDSNVNFAEVLQTTLAGNRSLVWGGGLASAAADALFDRVILWGNCADAQGDDGWFANSSCRATFVCCALDPSNMHSGTLTYEGEQVKQDPGFCDPADCMIAPTAAGDYRLNVDSPCLPEASPCESLIGALGPGCGAVPTRNTSWGGVKARFAP